MDISYFIIAIFALFWLATLSFSIKRVIQIDSRSLGTRCLITTLVITPILSALIANSERSSDLSYLAMFSAMFIFLFPLCYWVFYFYGKWILGSHLHK
jgi:hypothetical protein